MQTSSGAEPLRVMTFNIRGFFHPNDGANQWEHREELNIATIRQMAPHLIGMQEVQTGNLKAYDRELSEYHWLAWPEYGNNKPFEWPAIYWDPRRLRPQDSGGFWLSESPECYSRSWETDCIRSAQWIRFRDLASGEEFVHVNTHLDHRSVLARVEGSRLILKQLDELSSSQAGTAVPHIATGDFNDVPGSVVHRTWGAAGFVDAHAAAGCSDEAAESYTNHGWRGWPFAREDDTPQRIDWIMVRGTEVRSCAIVRDGGPVVWPSDHFPVMAELVFSADGTG